MLKNKITIHFKQTVFLFTKFILYNLLGQSIRTSMQNLEYVAQKMAELLHNYIIFGGHFVFEVHFSKNHNLLGLSIQTSMPNLEYVAQKMADLLHNYVRFGGHFKKQGLKSLNPRPSLILVDCGK